MRRIVFIGNCQAQALAEAFTQHIAPFTGDQARHIAATVDLNEAGRAALEGADVIVELVFDFAQRVSLSALGLTAPVIAVPYVNCQFLWPHAYEAHPHNAPTAFLDSGPYPIQLSDAYLNRLIREGVATEEAAARYLDLDINQHVRLDRRLEMGLALQRRRDEQTGFAVADLIARHFRDEPVFLTPDHPNRRIFLHIAQHCFERLGVPSHVIARLPHVMRRSLFLQDELPVHPRLAAHFGLTWASADRRYPFWLDGDFTFAEFIVRYLRYEWCEDFAAGHHLARLGERGAAIAQLRAGLAAHPAAGRAWALLSHVHAADGAVSAALAAAREAVALMPREAEFFAHLGNLLTQSDDPAGARAAYERAVALEPEHTPWLRLLAGHFERAGARAEAGALVANIAQKDSLDYVLHLQRGHFLAERGDPSGAASAFFHALGIAPHAKGIHAGLSHALAALGRREAAITEARAALVETPENHDLRRHLGNLLRASGDAAGADAVFREAIRDDPSDPEPYRGLAAVEEAEEDVTFPVENVSAKGDDMRSTVIQKLYRSRDPFAGFPAHRYALDVQGWGSDHPYLTEAMDTVRPRVVVEIGVWKGGSTLTMARRLKELRLDAVVIAVDTWLGSREHWLNEEWFGSLGFENGYPTLAHVFMANVVKSGLQDYVVPLPLDSLNAAQLLQHLNIVPDVVHVDGGHDYEAVSADLRVWWELLKPGGLLIGDDYDLWPEVKRGFDDFFGPRGLTPFEFGSNKCRIRKPLPRKLYLMTAHATLVGVDHDGNLTQLDSADASAGRALCITESKGKFVVEDDILRDFTLEIYHDGLSFKKNGKYLCALENSAFFAVDRENRAAWEVFQPTDERGLVGHFHDQMLSLPFENDHVDGDESIVPVLRHLLEQRPPQKIMIVSEDGKAASRAASLLLEAAELNGRSIEICTELPADEVEQENRPSSAAAEQPEANADFSVPELIVVADASAFSKFIHGLSKWKARKDLISFEIVILTSEIDLWRSTFLENPTLYYQLIWPMTAVVWPNLVHLSKRTSRGMHLRQGVIIASSARGGVTYLTEGWSLPQPRAASTFRIFRPILEELGRLKAEKPCALLIQFDDDAPRDIVSVGYGRRRGLRNNVRLVPDPYFMDSKGFAPVRREALEGRLPKWDQRQDMVFWRGSATTYFKTGSGESVEHLEQVPRIAMCLALKDQPRVDAAIMYSWDLDMHLPASEVESVTEWLKKRNIFRPGEPMINHAKYRFLLDIDGVANAWGFFEKLLLGACVLKISSPFEQWFYSEISEWQHFVPVKHDMSDLIEKIEWCRQHEDEARAIAERGQRFALDHTYEVAMAAARDAVERSLIPGDVAERASGLSAAALKAALESAA
jgi:tetratricopeptide (TPR) repeat protein